MAFVVNLAKPGDSEESKGQDRKRTKHIPKRTDLWQKPSRKSSTRGKKYGMCIDELCTKKKGWWEYERVGSNKQEGNNQLRMQAAQPWKGRSCGREDVGRE
jgi:hypothetical protein